MFPQPKSRSEPSLVDAIRPVQPDLVRILEQQVDAGFPPELALDLVLNELVVRAVGATRASSAALALARGHEMVCRAATGYQAPDLGVPLNTRDGLSGACLRTRQPQLCRDTESDERVDAAIARHLGIRSMLVVPVLDGDDLTGVLEVFSSDPATFSERDQILLEASGRDCVRIRHAALELRQRPPAVLQPDPLEPPAFIASANSHGPTTQPLYETWTLVLGTLAILAAIAVSFMIGSRIGWLRSAPTASHVQAPQSDSAPTTPQPAPAKRPASQGASSAARRASNADRVSDRVGEPSSPNAAEELVVYDHGKVIFRMRPAPPKHGASPVVAASKSIRLDSPSLGLPPIVWIAPDQAESRLRSRVEPQYPADALAAHRSGSVVLEVLVAEDGSVASIRTLSGDPLLAAAAADAVRNWRYEPYRRNQRPSQFQTDVTLTFTLPN